MALPHEKGKPRVKMVGMTPHGFDNIPRYCFLEENNKPLDVIANGMYKRLASLAIYSHVRMFKFYDTDSNVCFLTLPPK